MSNKVLLQWSYTPKSFLESIHELDYEGFQIKLKDGSIFFETVEEFYESDPDFSSKIEKFIEKYLDGISIQSHTRYKLSQKPTKYYDKDGNLVKQSVTPKTIASSVLIGTNVEVLVTDTEGNIIHDSRKERIEKKNLGVS